MWDKELNYTSIPTGRLSKTQILVSELKKDAINSVFIYTHHEHEF